MSESFSALGFLVHRPCGPRKSGMPDSVEMPAPVNATTRLAWSIQPRTRSMSFTPSVYRSARPRPVDSLQHHEDDPQPHPCRPRIVSTLYGPLLRLNTRLYFR